MAKKKINSKDKGNRAENELAKILSERFTPHKFKRNVSSGAMFGGMNRKYAEGVEETITTALSGDIIVPSNFKYSLEHKAYKEISFWDLFNDSSDLHSWLKQAEGDANFTNRKPMVIAKFNNRKRICFVKDKFDGYVFEHCGWYCYWFEDFLKLEDSIFFNIKD
jgi:hypothetical protein